MATNNSFAVNPLVNNSFINIYSDDNPILNIGDEGYFLFHNNQDYHKLLIGRGIIFHDTINSGMNKIYYIILHEIIETPKIVHKFVIKRQFMLYKKTVEKIKSIDKNFGYSVKYIMDETDKEFFENNMFKIDGFFMRANLNAIIELKKDFNKVIIDDLQNQIKDLEE